MDAPVFKGIFTQQAAIPEEGITAALAVLRSGRIHRYNTLGDEPSETALLEKDYAEWQGAEFCLACASGGQAMQIALRAAGVSPGDTVLTNAFTLAPVPGAIAAVGGQSVLVEITEDLVIDLADLERKQAQSGARYLLLSHMRGHLADMDRLTDMAARLGLIVIEDCAHTMGATWAGTRSGNFGLAGCFSTQTYKHINSGEGGLLTSNDPDFMARAIILSGSYMLYDRHGAAPAEQAFEAPRLDMPNMSARMDNLRAAILRPQLASLESSILAWNLRYDAVARHLAGCTALVLPTRPPQGRFVGSSIQFRIPQTDGPRAEHLLERWKCRGVEVKWFGRPTATGFTSTHHDWGYLDRQDLPRTDRILSGLFDMRLPLSFSVEDCDVIGRILVEEAVWTESARSSPTRPSAPAGPGPE
ncbi:dTDP-4-amino-4,6-dideoxygalactose transaminase [Hoeflea marina]|uniref:dTDP-4-amino-4,6-dideoxygalactose transaminase n=1 Tax=Hoeflea marina TaxID=274592 RepID=A0A317PFQ0_9HYPH|nr:aminotransferase class I/II-fold pyridoxal phosphate-dependent enzyme [Hoeflea marina]PWV97752.1 dTDP-4-amino-4,6-dideoxygalactose transaminase [Hoeflea marina]